MCVILNGLILVKLCGIDVYKLKSCGFWPFLKVYGYEFMTIDDHHRTNLYSWSIHWEMHVPIGEFALV